MELLHGNEPMVPANGWQNIGRMYKFAQTLDLNVYEFRIYMAIVEYTIGYCQAISISLSQDKLIEITGISSRTTITKNVKSLIDRGLIERVATNEQIGAKQPSKYKVVFQSGIDIKLNDKETKKEESSIIEEETKFEKIKKLGF